MNYSQLKFLTLMTVFSVHTFSMAYADENPFLRFDKETLSRTETFYSNHEVIKAPAGNGPVTQIPEFPKFTQYFRLAISGSGLSFTQEGRSQIAVELSQKNIPEIMQSLDREGLLQEAVRLSKIFKIDPLHILGPIIGENSFNGAIDRTIKNSYQHMFQQSDIETMSKRMSEIINHPEAKNCLNSNISNYWKWRCILFYSERSTTNSNSDLIRWFYSISGKKMGSFGIGQIQPFLLWSLNDVVTAKTQFESFEITDADKPMHIIFNNKEMLAYIAASAIVSIQVYKLVAGVDISANPGLTTTLYNVGDEYRRAYNFANIRAQTSGPIYPEVNYMGWFINQNAEQIRTYLKRYK